MNCEHSQIQKITNRSDSSRRLVFVHDPTDDGDYVIPIGKQTLRPSHIFYTPCSGIWQTVWLEAAPENYITQLDIDGNMDGQGEYPKWVQAASTNLTIDSQHNCAQFSTRCFC